MDNPPNDNGGDMGNLNANRNTIADDSATPGAGAASAGVSSGTRTETLNAAAAPVVVASFDWKKWAPWIIGVIILLVVVWLLTRKRGGGGGGGSASA